MASSGHRRRKPDPNPAEQTGASYLKIIRQSTVRDQKLLILGKFVTDSAGGLLKWSSATLKTRDGVEWEFGLVREEGKQDVCFGNHGWERFAEYYSLEYGHSLIFKYLGRSAFSVIIFDRSTMEIDYPDAGRIEQENGGDGVGNQGEYRQRRQSRRRFEQDGGAEQPSSSSTLRKRRAR